MRLLPDHPLYLNATGDKPDPKRFLQLFRATWQKIGLSWRRAFLNAWRASPLYSGTLLRGYVPSTTTSTAYDTDAPELPFTAVSITDIPFEPLADQPDGRYCPLTRHLRFFTPWLYARPPKYAQCVIAHELAHLAQCANEKDAEKYIAELQHARENPEQCFEGDTWVELEADDMVQAYWGFPKSEANQWRADHEDQLNDIYNRRTQPTE